MVDFDDSNRLFLHKRMTAHSSDVSQADGIRFSRAITLLLCWVGVYIDVFSLAQTKLPSYVTPCYPALALMAGVFVYEWRTSISFHRIWLKVGLGNLIAVGTILLIALPIAAGRFLPGSEWVGVIGLVPLVGGIVVWALYQREEHRAATTSLTCTAIAFMALLLGVLPAEIGRHRHINQLLNLTTQHDGTDRYLRVSGTELGVLRREDCVRLPVFRSEQVHSVPE